MVNILVYITEHVTQYMKNLCCSIASDLTLVVYTSMLKLLKKQTMILEDLKIHNSRYIGIVLPKLSEQLYHGYYT